MLVSNVVRSLKRKQGLTIRLLSDVAAEPTQYLHVLTFDELPDLLGNGHCQLLCPGVQLGRSCTRVHERVVHERDIEDMSLFDFRFLDGVVDGEGFDRDGRVHVEHD